MYPQKEPNKRSSTVLPSTKDLIELTKTGLFLPLK